LFTRRRVPANGLLTLRSLRLAVCLPLERRMSDLGYIVLCLAGLLGYAGLLYRVLQRRPPRPAVDPSFGRAASTHGQSRR